MLSKHNSPTHFIPLPTQYQIPLTQSALNTQFPYTLPLPQIIQIPETICCQNIIPTLPSVLTLYQIHLTQSALSTKSTYHKVLLQFFLFQIFSPALSSIKRSPISQMKYPQFKSKWNIKQNFNFSSYTTTGTAQHQTVNSCTPTVTAHHHSLSSNTPTVKAHSQCTRSCTQTVRAHGHWISSSTLTARVHRQSIS